MVSKHEYVESTVVASWQLLWYLERNIGPLILTILLSTQLLVHYYQAAPS